MNVKKTLISVMIVGILLSVAILPATGETSPDTETVSEGTVDKMLRVMMMSEDGIEITEEIVTMSEDDLQELEGTINSLSDYLSENIEISWRNFGFDANKQEEIAQEIETALTKMREIMPDLPEINASILFKSLIPLMLGRVSIISVGYGHAMIPFYTYETSLGILLRPIFIKYWLGFSAILHLNLCPLRAVYGDRLGTHKLTTFGFKGIYINLGDIGLDHANGLVLLIGSSLIAPRLGRDIP